MLYFQVENLASAKLEDLYRNQGGIDRFRAKMSEEGTWGDGSMLAVASLLYNKQIVVYQEKSSPISLRDAQTFSDPNPIRLGYVNNNHYISLKPKEATTPQTCHKETATEPGISQSHADSFNSTEREREQVDEPGDDSRQRNSSTHGRKYSSLKATDINENEQVYSATTSATSQPTDLGKLDELPVQPKRSAYCPRVFGSNSKIRDFKSSWFAGRDWLEFSVQANAAFCYCCRHFGASSDKTDQMFINGGYTNWKAALERGKGFIKHASSASHVQAMFVWNDRKLRSESGCKVSSMVNEQQVQKNRYYVKSVVGVLQFLCLNELPMRGHGASSYDSLWESSDEEPSGLFLRLFQYTLSKDIKLRDVAKSIPQNATYMSAMFQNEVVDLMSSMVREAIVANINTADIPFFTLKADGTRDPTNTENVSIVIRYVKDAVPREDLLALATSEKLDAKSLCETILTTVSDSGLEPSHILAQCYDGASVMSGKNGGVQKFVSKALQKYVPYVHCFNHQLHLVVVHAVSLQPEFQQYFEVCDMLYNFLRRPILAHLYEGNKLKRLLEQRWSGHLATTTAMLENYDAIVDVLTVCGTSAEVDGNTCVEASGLLQKVENAKFLFIAYTVRHILELLRPADQILQARASHLLTGITVVSACITSIKALRSHDHIQKLVVKIEKQGIQLNATSVSKRKRRMPTALAQCVVETTLGNHDGDFDDVRTELAQLYFQGIDNCVSELEARFGERHAALASALECLWPQNQAFLQMSKLSAITDLINIKESSLAVSECEVARQMIAKDFDPESHKDLSDVCRLLFPLRAAFPNVYSIYAAALTFGVSTAACEASFSTLTRVLTPCRRSMTQSRKANLVLLSFQSQYTRCLDLDKFVNSFAQKSRKLQL